jgi:hypothetical protein
VNGNIFFKFRFLICLRFHYPLCRAGGLSFRISITQSRSTATWERSGLVFSFPGDNGTQTGIEPIWLG